MLRTDIKISEEFLLACQFCECIVDFEEGLKLGDHHDFNLSVFEEKLQLELPPDFGFGWGEQKLLS